MKRILTLALVAAFVMGLAGFASAKEVQMKGQFVHNLTWIDNADFQDDNAEDDFTADQRVRVYFDYVASETLNAVLGFEINSEWGNIDEGGALATDGIRVQVKHAYTNFVVPNTPVNVRVGLQPVAWPGAYGSPIFDDDAAGILVSSPITDNVAITLGWVRGYDDVNSNDRNPNDDMDIFTALLPVKGDGFAVTPYVIYSALGQDAMSLEQDTKVIGQDTAGKDVTAKFNRSAFASTDTIKGLGSLTPASATDDIDVWWGGLNFEVSMLDPFTFKGDVIYGTVKADQDQNDRAGWFADLGVEYKFSFATLGIMGLYGSGDDDDLSDGSEAMPVLNDSGFGLTHFGFSGATTGGQDGFLGAARYDMWAIGAYLLDLSFVEDLSHKLIVVYGQGTTDSEAIDAANYNNDFAPTLTDEDSFIEVNFDTTYMIYENLAAIVELGYINMDRDEDTWKGTDREDADDDALKAAFYLKYDF
ncbi:outer membrane homotrimeric porin [Desulfobaculum bizertense]|uniref:outer membrane homotrimeric porin n=1 Tax=Desulfobaculum bizertense TaxID=376490 RepID=UPI001F3ECAD8|nr:outer membrane homotrimeric porin [Desulfobaculum bizertense]UIJ38180.1 outer membrane homotrimeric porin [Desulfobaculum bizertense]